MFKKAGISDGRQLPWHANRKMEVEVKITAAEWKFLSS